MHGKESEKRGCASHELFIMWSTFLVSGMTTFERPAGVFKLEYCNNCIINKKEFCICIKNHLIPMFVGTACTLCLRCSMEILEYSCSKSV